jgi:hypothetical protein
MYKWSTNTIIKIESIVCRPQYATHRHRCAIAALRLTGEE